MTYASERPGLNGPRARLPDLPKRVTLNDIAVTRGLELPLDGSRIGWPVQKI